MTTHLTTTDRSAETPMPACATHTVRCVLVLQAEVPVGTTPEHLAEYITSFFVSEPPDLHEDIAESLDDAKITCRARPVHSSLAQAAGFLVQDVVASEVSS